jgi:uncharacterized protein YdhG (YjbR/CyaY superfamily)
MPPKAKPANIDDYIAGFPPDTKKTLERVRTLIRNAVPNAEETISYQIPAFKVGGRVAIYFAAWKEHYSLYPAGEALVQKLGTELSRYEVTKGTIRFPLSEPVPAKLIEQIAQFKAEETRARGEKAKTAKQAKAAKHK